MNLFEIKDIVLRTIDILEDQCYISHSDHLSRMIKEISEFDPKNTMCCPLCQEVSCDGGCPFEVIRQ